MTRAWFRPYCCRGLTFWTSPSVRKPLLSSRITARLSPGALANALTKAGLTPVILRFPESFLSCKNKLPAKVETFNLKNESEESLTSALADIAAGSGPVRGFIHLSAKAPKIKKGQLLFSETGNSILRHVFLIAKHLKATLNDAPDGGRSFFLTQTQMDGELGTGSSFEFDLVQGGFNGLAKTLNLEWPNVFARSIDLSPELNDKTVVENILAELFDPDLSVTEVGYSPKGRQTITAISQEFPKPEGPYETVSESSLFLVTGGAKGVTADCVIRLAEKFKCKFMLMGRSAYSGSIPDFAKDIIDETELKKAIMLNIQQSGEKPTPMAVNKQLRVIQSEREINKTLEAVKAAGGKAEYLSVDVTSEADVREKISNINGVSGVIHGAGVLADKPIEKKLEGDYDAVISTKVTGLKNLFASIPGETIKQLVLFSSVAGYYGNPGQADYAIANEILNKTAYAFRNKFSGAHVLSVNWGPWDGGMVTPELKRFFSERGVPVIPIEEGTRILRDALHNSRKSDVQLLVGASMRTQPEINGSADKISITRELLVKENPFLEDHKIGDNPVLPSANAMNWMARTIQNIYPDYHLLQCEDFQVLKGIVFDGKQADQYELNVEKAGLENNGEAVFPVKISSGENGKLRFHYRANIRLASVKPQIPVYNQVDLGEKQPVAGDTLYSNGTLFHGPLFQGITRILNHSDAKLTAECLLPEIKAEDQGRFPHANFNPFVVDLMFQAMLVQVRNMRDSGSLPLKIQKIEMYRTVQPGSKFYISLDVQTSSENNMIASINVHDESGLIYIRATGAEVTISEGLNALFARA